MDAQMQQVFSILLGRIVKESPHLGEIMDRAKEGEIDLQQALTEMFSFIKENPELEQKILGMQTTLTAAGDIGADLSSDPRAEWLVQLKEDGLPQLNPLFEAHLIERSQFDSDMPELRTGPLAEGVEPAVSVDTKAKSPALLGKMLETASKKTGKKIEKHERERRELIQEVAEADENGVGRRPMLEAINANEGDLSLVKKHGATIAQAADGMPVAALLHGSPETDHPDYKRREIPKPMKVSRVRGSTLLKMTEEEKRKNAWKFLSTSAGRRTAVGIIRELIAVHLEEKGFDVIERDYDKKLKNVTILSHHEWTVQLGGPRSTQSSFSLIDMAAKALAINLVRNLPPDSHFPMILEVDTVDTLADREVGWAARLLPEGIKEGGV